MIYSDVNVNKCYQISFLLFLFFIATDVVVLLIKYKNDGVLRVAELKDHYCLLLK